jgi:hypothetical protein
MFDNPLILLAGGVLGIIGFAILLYVGLQMLREERAAKDAVRAPTEATAAEIPPSGAGAGAAARPEPAAKPPAPAKPAARAKGSAHEVMRVLRDNLTGRLVIEVAGRRYASLDELQDAALAEALLTTLTDLHTFTGEAAPAALPPAAAERALPAPAVPPAPTPSAPPPAPGPAKPLPPPTMNPFKQMQVLRELAKNPPTEPKSITEQIDEMLQEKIAGTPLAERNLRMRLGRRGEALFDLDGESYPSVDEVPDMEVREVLKGAIAAWEQTR